MEDHCRSARRHRHRLSPCFDIGYRKQWFGRICSTLAGLVTSRECYSLLSPICVCCGTRQRRPPYPAASRSLSLSIKMRDCNAGNAYQHSSMSGGVLKLTPSSRKMFPEPVGPPPLNLHFPIPISRKIYIHRPPHADDTFFWVSFLCRITCSHSLWHADRCGLLVVHCPIPNLPPWSTSF